MGDLAIEWLGQVPYAEALTLQRERLDARRCGEVSDALLLLEHPPVVTLGRSAKREHLLLEAEALHARGVELHEAARGGDVTYHAPGQLVGYLIVDLAARGQRDAHRFLREIEAGVGDAVRSLGVEPTTIPGMTGVFVAPATANARPRKLASIGVGLKNWVSWHGFALNVDIDLAGFSSIVACGLHDVEMSSLARELEDAGARQPGLRERAREAIADAFAKRF